MQIERINLVDGVTLGVVHIEVAGAILAEGQAGPTVVAHEKGGIRAWVALVVARLHAQRLQDLGHLGHQRQRRGLHPAGQAVDAPTAEIAFSDHLVRHLSEGLAISDGPVEAIFFIGKQHHTYRAAWPKACRRPCHQARSRTHDGHASPIVHSPLAQVPGVQMRADQDHFMRQVGAWHLTHDVVGDGRHVTAVVHLNAHAKGFTLGHPCGHHIGIGHRNRESGNGPYPQVVAGGAGVCNALGIARGIGRRAKRGNTTGGAHRPQTESHGAAPRSLHRTIQARPNRAAISAAVACPLGPLVDEDDAAVGACARRVSGFFHQGGQTGILGHLRLNATFGRGDAVAQSGHHQVSRGAKLPRP